MVTAVTTPWGKAVVVEEIVISQEADGRRFASIVQLLEDPAGRVLVRYAYSTGDTARRGPVTLRQEDLSRLRAAARTRPRLEQALGWESS